MARILNYFWLQPWVRAHSLVSDSLPKGVTAYDILHAVVVNGSVVILGNHTFRYAMYVWVSAGEAKGTVSLG